MKYKRGDLFKDLKTGEIVCIDYITCGDYACKSFDGMYELKNEKVNTYFDLTQKELEDENLYLPLKVKECEVTNVENN